MAAEASEAGAARATATDPTCHVYLSCANSSGPLVSFSATNRLYRATAAMTRSRAADLLCSGVAIRGILGSFALLTADETVLHGAGAALAPDYVLPDKLV